MTEMQFQPVRLARRWPEAEGLWGLALDLAGTDLAASFQQPGQYVQVRTPSGAIAYLAIASRPGEPAFEFLVKGGAAAADELIALPEGAPLAVTKALGKGYPLAGHEGKDVLLFAVGTGISPIRPLIWHLAGRLSDFAGVTLFFGARTPAHFAYQGELEAWSREGIGVVKVVSAPDAAAPGTVAGYVQDALKAHPLRPEETVAFVCGMPAMAQAVIGELAGRGMNPDHIYQNY